MTERNRSAKAIVGLIVVLLGVVLLQFVVSPISAQTVLLAVIAGLMAMLVIEPRSSRSDQLVEYKTVPPGTLNQSMLEEFGKDGWRLVCVDQAGSGYIFVR